jgi:phenylalanyl-tRNA synthetase alpha chain
LLKARRDPFLVIGDVYRRDAIDRTHYPVFHQCEGVKVFPPGTPVAEVEKDLKMQLERLCRSLFGAEAEMRWVDAYFPFTEPSFELEVFFDGKWLECLGCGVIHRDVLKNAGRGNEVGWAFGLGLERLAMVLFGIPDIRLFWSSDARFLKQFENASAHSTKFEAFSKYPVCYKDISFWVPREGAWNDNDFFESVRNTCGDLVESVECIDEFVHPKTGRTSKCFRINYCAVDRTLTNEEVDALQVRVRDGTVAQFGVELR